MFFWHKFKGVFLQFRFDEIDIFPFQKKKKTVVVSVRDQRDQNQNYISTTLK
jgi:late competence protein required for DNA uptake (superfamily II DNA/RNA helicase)